MPAPARELWLKNFDPSHYLSGVRCPILFLNGTHDFAYPLDSYQKSYRLVKPQLRNVSVVMKLAHGHIWTFQEPNEFIARTLRREQFPKMSDLRIEKDRAHARSNVQLKEAVLNWTKDEGPWQTREWKSIPAVIWGKNISAMGPEVSGPVIYMMMGVTKDGLRVSSEYVTRQRRDY
jgi:hypothetical protein